MKFLSMSHSRASSLSPGRIALGYAVVATLWIVFSDAFVTRLHLPPGTETIKGAFFVVVTAVLLYFTIRRLVQALERTSEARREQAELLNLTHDTVLVMDMAGAIQYWNRGAEEQYGWSADQTVGRVVHDLLKTVFPAPVEQIKAEVTRAGRWEGELVHTRQDGTQVVVASRWSLQRDRQGVPVAILETNNDITERKRAEETLRRLTRELRAISNCNQVLLRATDEQSLLEEICRIVCDEAGYRVVWVGYAEHDEPKSVRPVAWTGTDEETLANLGITWADTERGRGPCGTAIRTGKTCCIKDYATEPREVTWTGKTLQHGLCCAIGLPLKDEQGNTFGSLNIYAAQPNAFTPDEVRLLEELANDLAFGIVTLRSRAARERAEQEVALLTFALDKVHEAAFLMDEARLTYVNEAACRRLGYSREELLRLGVADIDPDFPGERWADHWRDLKAQKSLTFESRHRTREGRVFPVEISANYFEYGGRAYNLALARDITERKRVEEERRESAERLRAIADYTYDWENWIGIDGKLLWVNPAVVRITGYSVAECMAMPEFPVPIVAEVDRESVAEQMREAVQGSSRNDFEFRVRHKDGRLVWAAASWQPIYDSRGARLGHRSSMRDITERKRAEEEVRKTAAQWQATFDAVQDLVLLLDKDFRILRANRAAAEFLGLRPDELVGGHCYDLMHGTSTPPAECPLAKMRQSRRHEEVEILAREGGPWLSVSVDPLFNPSGELTQVVHVARDITERKRAEEALRRTAAYLAETQRLTHTGTFVSDETTKPLYWSEELFRIFGFDPQHGLPAKEQPPQRIHPEDLDKFSQAWQRALRDKVDVDVEYRIVLPDGTTKHVYGIGHPVLDANGKLVEIVGTTVDITERKRTEEELRKHREHLEELVKQRTEELAVLNQLVYGSLESGEVGAWWIDFKEPDTCHALDNTARMLGWEPDPTGKKTYKLGDWTRLLVDTAAAFPEYAAIIEESHERFAGAVAGKYGNYRAVYPLALPDGSLKWIDGRAEIAKRDERGQALLMTGTFIDVTRSKRAEADLAEAKGRAETANRAKSTFLANMSHELRTPLNAVLGFSRLLKNDPNLKPPQQETLDVIVRSGEHLLNLINNVLDMAKIESGRVVLKESEVDLPRLLHEMQSLLGVGAVERGLRFALEHDPDLPRFVAVDADKLRQVLLNLLGNAIKHTESGGVKLRARLASLRGAEKARVRFEVEDSGPGISQEDCQRIFTPFVQVGEQSSAQTGTGLGLAICKQYVELMGGKIGVTSQLGKGSVFHFEIPVTILESVAEHDELQHPRVLGLAEGQPRHRLLIVEDQPENRLLLRRILAPFGFEMREAVNGQEAVALFEQWHPDLIWMDIRMPVMDGLEAVRRIRATPAGAQTKIVALTAHALEEEREPIMAAGCDDLVRKPFQEHELFGALARHLRLKFIYETSPRPSSAPEPSELSVRPEQLNALPRELLQELRQAVLELDTARTHALIEQVSQRDAALGRSLNTLANRLDFKRLLKLLETDHPETGPKI